MSSADTFIQSNLHLVHSSSMKGHLGVQYLAQGHFGMQMGKTEDWTANLTYLPTKFTLVVCSSS